MQQYQCKQPIRQTELSIKTDLLDANCGGALGGIICAACLHGNQAPAVQSIHF